MAPKANEGGPLNADGLVVAGSLLAADCPPITEEPVAVVCVKVKELGVLLLALLVAVELTIDDPELMEVAVVVMGLVKVNPAFVAVVEVGGAKLNTGLTGGAALGVVVATVAGT